MHWHASPGTRASPTQIRTLDFEILLRKRQDLSLKSPEVHGHHPSVILAFPWHTRFADARSCSGSVTFTLQRPAWQDHWAHFALHSGTIFISSILFSDDRHAGVFFPMASMPSCLRAISGLPHPLRHMPQRGRKTHASHNRRFFFPLRVVSGKTCDSPCQIINISFQPIPHLMLTMSTSGSFNIFT